MNWHLAYCDYYFNLLKYFDKWIKPFDSKKISDFKSLSEVIKNHGTYSYSNYWLDYSR